MIKGTTGKITLMKMIAEIHIHTKKIVRIWDKRNFVTFSNGFASEQFLTFPSLKWAVSDFPPW